MDQHPIPRQITTFEFKLIGILTIKQFVYSLIFAGLTVIAYFIIAIPYLNFLAAFLVGAAGGAFVFVKYNERPLDIWIKNLALRLISPSQYYYIKHNTPPFFLKGLSLQSDPTIVKTHIDANRKLANYIAGQTPPPQNTTHQQTIGMLINQAVATSQPALTQQKAGEQTYTPILPSPPVQDKPPSNEKQPVMSGQVKNNKGVPLPDIMLYVKTSTSEVARILKTNHHGVFATFHSLPRGSYTIEPKDLKSKYFFDTMTLQVHSEPTEPIIIISKEYL